MWVTCSNRPHEPHKVVKGDEVEMLQPLQQLVIFSAPVLGLGLGLLENLGWGISTSFETTLNSSNFDKSCNKTRRCLSLFCSKLVLETHNWLR
jgi:hypothetical protein